MLKTHTHTHGIKKTDQKPGHLTKDREMAKKHMKRYSFHHMSSGNAN